MYIAMVCAAVGGVLLGLRFKVLVLIPAGALTAVVVAGVEFAHGMSLREIDLSILAAGAALQIGYVAGVALRVPRRTPTLPWIALMALLFHVTSASGAQAQHMRTGEPELAPLGLVEFCVRKPFRCAPTVPRTVDLTPARLAELATVNMAVNRSIEPAENSRNSATREWADGATVGFCDNYALAKRSLLIDRGWPSGALLIATAEIPSGDLHAVLVVVTGNGDLVLDNLRYGIVPYERLKYRWQKIMQPDNPQYWRRIISQGSGFPPEPLLCAVLRHPVTYPHP